MTEAALLKWCRKRGIDPSKPTRVRRCAQCHRWTRCQQSLSLCGSCVVELRKLVARQRRATATLMKATPEELARAALAEARRRGR